MRFLLDMPETLAGSICVVDKKRIRVTRLPLKHSP